MSRRSLGAPDCFSEQTTPEMRKIAVRSISAAIRNERTTTQTDPFQANPLGRGELADFLRCSLLTYRFRYARRSRLENQPTDDGGMPPTYDSMH
jgi:hypothetical protein